MRDALKIGDSWEKILGCIELGGLLIRNFRIGVDAPVSSNTFFWVLFAFLVFRDYLETCYD